MKRKRKGEKLAAETTWKKNIQSKKNQSENMKNINGSSNNMA